MEVSIITSGGGTHMLQKILVALDRSDQAAHVFETALTLAKATGASLLLFHVLSSEDETCPHFPVFIGAPYPLSGVSSNVFEVYQDLWQQYEEQGLAMLRSYAATALAAGVSTEFRQQAGNANHLICELARAVNSDLIVLGRRGYAGLNELILGSVSNYVLHHSACSVLVVQAINSTTEAIAEKALTVSS
jgi:nucleotide-binding universal stress UspA family protein